MKKKEENEVKELFICECSDIEHQIIMSYDKDEDIPMVFCSIHLIPEWNIFKRIRDAVRYVFGHRSAYGDFEEFIFRTKDADRLQTVVDYLNDIKRKEDSV